MALPLLARGMSRAQADVEANRLLDAFNLAHLAERSFRDLSGGEAQRVKLASELQRRSTGRTVYVLDEPTTGLHSEDIRKLLLVLQSLADKGNTVIVIEHNLDVIKSADWIIDMGPEGGAGGGTVVAQGTPEDVATVEESFTGQYLAEVLAKEAQRDADGS